MVLLHRRRLVSWQWLLRNKAVNRPFRILAGSQHKADLTCAQHTFNTPFALLQVQVSAGQRHAIKTCLTSQVSVLTGGPGCGKTWATAAMLKYWNSKKLTIAACAPTGW